MALSSRPEQAWVSVGLGHPVMVQTKTARRPSSVHVRSSTFRPKGFDVTVKYTQGSWTGAVGEDVVAIPRAFNHSFLVNVATIFQSENFFLPGVQWNGILGLAYATLAKVSRAGRRGGHGGVSGPDAGGTSPACRREGRRVGDRCPCACRTCARCPRCVHPPVSWPRSIVPAGSFVAVGWWVTSGGGRKRPTMRLGIPCG